MESQTFTWGDTVLVVAAAPARYRPNAAGSVSGIAVLENEERARAFDETFGTTVYLVEFPDGDAQEIPARWLRLLDA